MARMAASAVRRLLFCPRGRALACPASVRLATFACAAALLGAAGGPAMAADTAPDAGAIEAPMPVRPAADAGSALAPLAADAVAPPAPGEPQVRHIVVEDQRARIDELRIRGVTTRIHVQPKTPGTAAYEILPPDSSQQVNDGWPATRGARGQRVWNVLAF